MKRYKPLVDKLFWIIFIPTIILTTGMMMLSIYNLTALAIMAPLAIIVIYFFVSPFFGYVELREKTVFIKYGLLLKKAIPYSSIRRVSREHKFYSDSILSLKMSFDHLNIKYNAFDVTTVSVIENDLFVKELNSRLSIKQLRTIHLYKK